MGDAIALTVIGLAMVGLMSIGVLAWKAVGKLGALLNQRLERKGEASAMPTDNTPGM
jgi:hypothetical protein